jgi:hypothetical protein
MIAGLADARREVLRREWRRGYAEGWRALQELLPAMRLRPIEEEELARHAKELAAWARTGTGEVPPDPPLRFLRPEPASEHELKRLRQGCS